MLDFLTSKKFKILLIWLIFIFLVFHSFSYTLATGDEGDSIKSEPSPLEELEKIQEEVGKELMPPYEDPVLIIVKIINYLLTFIGVVFILMIIYGGLMWMTGPSVEEKVKKAKTLIKDAIIGLIIVILARVLYIFIEQRLKV